MIRTGTAVVLFIALFLAGCATSGTTTGAMSDPVKKPAQTSRSAGSNKALRGLSPHDAVEATERAFAKTMADRDFKAFKSFLADEAIFMSGPMPLRGKQRVAEAWQPYFESPEAPFSWEPERVVVLDSEGLAFSSGPVIDPDGATVGVFNSVWRRESSGAWRIVFDKGGCACE